MAFIPNNIYNLIYIAVIILGGVTLPLTLILNAKERDKQHKAIFLFVGAIFLYMVADFITYYFLGEMESGGIVLALITMSDTFFCMLITAWVYVIVVITKLEDKINMKLIVIISAVYLISSEFLSISLGRYNSYALHVESGIGKVILQALNAGYAIIIIAIGVYAIGLILERYERSANRSFNLIMLLLLISYMMWVIYWDYSTWYQTEENLLEIYAMDPLIMLYAIFNGFFIYYFYKKDPLRISENQIASEDAVRMLAQKYQLSEREYDVLDLLNKGKSNKEIAADLCISENTVKRHVNNIFRKTEAQSRHEVIFKISNINK